MPAPRRRSRRLQEKADTLNRRPSAPALTTTSRHPKVAQGTHNLRRSARLSTNAPVKIKHALSRSAARSAYAPRTQPSIASPNNTNQLPTVTPPKLPEIDTFHEAIHDIRRCFDPSLPPLHEMPGEPPIASGGYSNQYMFNRSYEASTGLVKSLRCTIDRSQSLDYGKMRKMDLCLAERRIDELGYLGRKWKRVPRKDVATRTDTCVIL